MTDLTPNHPAVEAAERAATRWMEDRELETDLDGTAYMLTAALPLLTSDTEENIARLRDTSVGRELMAEAWREALIWILYRDGRWPQDMEDDNPYRGEADQTIEKDLT